MKKKNNNQHYYDFIAMNLFCSPVTFVKKKEKRSRIQEIRKKKIEKREIKKETSFVYLKPNLSYGLCFISEVFSSSFLKPRVRMLVSGIGVLSPCRRHMSHRYCPFSLIRQLWLVRGI